MAGKIRNEVAGVNDANEIPLNCNATLLPLAIKHLQKIRKSFVAKQNEMLDIYGYMVKVCLYSNNINRKKQWNALKDRYNSISKMNIPNLNLKKHEIIQCLIEHNAKKVRFAVIVSDINDERYYKVRLLKCDDPKYRTCFHYDSKDNISVHQDYIQKVSLRDFNKITESLTLKLKFHHDHDIVDNVTEEVEEEPQASSDDTELHVISDGTGTLNFEAFYDEWYVRLDDKFEETFRVMAKYTDAAHADLRRKFILFKLVKRGRKWVLGKMVIETQCDLNDDPKYQIVLPDNLKKQIKSRGEKWGVSNRIENYKNFFGTVVVTKKCETTPEGELTPDNDNNSNAELPNASKPNAQHPTNVKEKIRNLTKAFQDTVSESRDQWNVESETLDSITVASA